MEFSFRLSPKLGEYDKGMLKGKVLGLQVGSSILLGRP